MYSAEDPCFHKRHFGAWIVLPYLVQSALIGGFQKGAGDQQGLVERGP